MNTNQKKAGSTILIVDKVDLTARNITMDMEGDFMMKWGQFFKKTNNHNVYA